MSIKQAMQHILEANPQIGEAIANREAIEFELEQAHGLYLPRLDLEAFAGVTKSYMDNNLNSGSSTQHTREAGLVMRQLIFDGFETSSEIEYQASRVDGASYRVSERSEFLALRVVRQYLEVGLQMRVVSLAERHLRALHSFQSKLVRGVEQGTTSDADRQQSTERVLAARAQITQARERLEEARTRFLKLVGVPLHKFQEPGSIRRKVPSSLAAAIGTARENNPTVKLTQADLDATYALLKKAESRFYPHLALELSGRAGEDLDGTDDVPETPPAETYRRRMPREWPYHVVRYK